MFRRSGKRRGQHDDGAPIVGRLSDVFMCIAREPEIEERVIAMGFTPAVADGEATRARLASHLVSWRAVVDHVGARVGSASGSARQRLRRAQLRQHIAPETLQRSQNRSVRQARKAHVEAHM